MMTNIMGMRRRVCNWTLREIECQAPRVRDFNLGGQLCEIQYGSPEGTALEGNPRRSVVVWTSCAATELDSHCVCRISGIWGTS